MERRETAFFFENGKGKRLFGFLHRPQESAEHEPRQNAIIYCSPLFEEKLNAHRVFVHFARYAASRGYPVLRFDYYGDGESEGCFQDASISSRLEDVQGAVEYLLKTVDVAGVFLLGLRLGGTLALLSHDRHPRTKGVVAWAPILKGQDYLYKVLRANLSYQLLLHKKVLHDRKALIEIMNRGELVNVDGYEISRTLFQEASSIDLTGSDFRLQRPALIIQISSNGKPANGTRETVEGNGSHCPTSKWVSEVEFWQPLKKVYPPCEELFIMTLDWIDEAGHPSAAGPAAP